MSIWQWIKLIWLWLGKIHIPDKGKISPKNTLFFGNAQVGGWGTDLLNLSSIFFK